MMALVASMAEIIGGINVRPADAGQARGNAVIIDSDSIGGVVTSSKGPEPGVWVIAETSDLPTKFIKIVMTDDQGRYVLPDLPKVSYKLFVRGYGLVDSERISAKPGQQLNLKAVVAPDGRAAAQVYPAEYWLSLVKIPAGDLSPTDVALAVKNCLQCHQLGDKATREVPDATMKLGTFKSSADLWNRRVRSGPAGEFMNGVFESLGAQSKMFADWTDRIAAGEYPTQAPPRPTGIERNVVVTMWDWGGPTSYMHDAAASDTRNPMVNANGLVFGPSQYDNELDWVDPIEGTTGRVNIPSSATPSGWTPTGEMFAASPFWDNEKIWLSAAQPRSSAVDQQGRAWIAAKIRGSEQPAFCKTGSTNKFARYFPMDKPSGKQVAFYDPKSKKVAAIDTCFSADHNQFAQDSGNSIFFGQSDVIGWISSSTYDKTHNDEAAQGWGPVVLNTKGDGKITKPWTEPDDPIDPTKDHRIHFPCYKIAVSPADGSAWCSGIGPTSRKLVRLSLGSNPPETMIGEVYEPPETVNGVPLQSEGGVDVDSNGVVWQNWRGTDQVTSFDRRKCKVLNGPTATGLHCPEGWTIYRKQGPSMQGGTVLNANYLYLLDVDRHNVLGLGNDVPITFPVNSDALLALDPRTGKFISLHIPYPMGFLARSVNARIDDPKAGWKGRGLWSNYANFGIWHVEGGKGVKPKLVKFQLRPDPLAK